jgi:hypothetical protein
MKMKKGMPEKVRPKRRVLQPIELHAALFYQIRRLQQEQFPSEMACLTAKKPKDVKRSSRIAKFHPYWDPMDRVIKLRGRTGLSIVLKKCPDQSLPDRVNASSIETTRAVSRWEGKGGKGRKEAT